MTVGEKIQYHRKRIALSQKELAQQLEVGKKEINLWESDKAVPTVDEVRRMTAVFGCSFDDVLGTSAPEAETAPKESYRFVHSIDELKGIAVRVARPLLIAMAIFSALAIGLFLYNVLSHGDAVVSILVGILFFAVNAIIAKRYLDVRVTWQRSYGRISESIYYYDVNDEGFTLKVSRGGETVKTVKVAYSEIEKVIAMPAHILLQIAGQLHIIKREALAENSLLLMKLRDVRAALAPKRTAGKLKLISETLITLSVVGFFAAFLLVALLPTSGMSASENMWIFLTFIPIPAALIAYSVYLEKRGYRHRSEQIVGIVIAALMTVFGVFSFLVVDPYDHSDAPIAEAEKALSIDIPNHIAINTITMDGDPDATKSVSEIYFTEGEVAGFEESLATDKKWVAEIPEAIAPAYCDGMSYDYAAVLNTKTGELNAIPTESGDYTFLAALYFAEDNIMLLVEYDLKYSK